MNVSSWLGPVEAGFGLLVILAGAFAVFRGAYLTAQLKLLRGDRDDYKERADRLEGDIERLKVALKAAEEKITVLEDLAIGKETLNRIDNRTRRIALKLDVDPGEQQL